MDAYVESDIKSDIIALRYRNVEPFEYQTHNLLDFLRDNLNTSLELPVYIPGSSGSKQDPSSASIQLTFDLTTPKGTGTVLIASGLHKSETPDSRNVIEKQVIVWQLEVVSGGVCVSDCLRICQEKHQCLQTDN